MKKIVLNFIVIVTVVLSSSCGKEESSNSTQASVINMSALCATLPTASTYSNVYTNDYKYSGCCSSHSGAKSCASTGNAGYYFTSDKN